MTKRLIKAKRVIYLGPTLPGVAKEGTVYIDGVTIKLEEACKKLPQIKEFIVPMDEYDKVSGRIKASDDAMSSIYDDIKKKWRE